MYERSNASYEATVDGAAHKIHTLYQGRVAEGKKEQLKITPRRF